MNKRIVPRPTPELPRTKEQFMIEWVLTRAAFRDAYDGVGAARSASEVWNAIQKLKD